MFEIQAFNPYEFDRANTKKSSKRMEMKTKMGALLANRKVMNARKIERIVTRLERYRDLGPSSSPIIMGARNVYAVCIICWTQDSAQKTTQHFNRVQIKKTHLEVNSRKDKKNSS